MYLTFRHWRISQNKSRFLASLESFEDQAIWRQQYRDWCWVVVAPFQWDSCCLARHSAPGGHDLCPCPFSPQFSQQAAAFMFATLGIKNNGEAEMRWVTSLRGWGCLSRCGGWVTQPCSQAPLWAGLFFSWLFPVAVSGTLSFCFPWPLALLGCFVPRELFCSTPLAAGYACIFKFKLKWLNMK